MSLSVGIVGLPNVGKSTLFNALLKKQQALAANYPFATIEPNTGIVEIPDQRLAQLAKVVATNVGKETSQIPIKPATIEFVDIAGLVEGASKGEGLGNQFLANIRETNLICHVMRAFEDTEVVITGEMNPVSDLETVRMELAYKDIETLANQDKAVRQLRDPIISQTKEKALQVLSNNQMINQVEWSEKEWEWLKSLHLLTAKPEIFVINVGESSLEDKNEQLVGIKQDYSRKIGVDPESIVIVSAKIEAELAQLDPEEQQIFLSELGMEVSGLERMAKTAYDKLNLISYLTAGEKEIRAWTITKGMSAPEAAGVIHTDFEKKFIKAEVVDWQTFVEQSGWKNARENGKIRMEGKDYLVKDGDVIDFKIGS